MDQATTVGLYLEAFAVLAVSVAAASALLRRSSRPAILLSLATFAGLFGVVGLFLLDATEHDVADGTLGGAMANVAFALVPALLFAFGRQYHRVRPSVARAVNVFVACYVVVVASLPIVARAVEPQRWWHTASQVTIGLLALVLLSTVARWLWRDGSAVRSAVVRNRMRLLAASVVGVLMAYVLSAIPTPLTHALLGYVVAASALTMLVSFAPPPSVRAGWRRASFAGMEETILHLMAAVDRQHVLDEALPTIADIVGARRVALLDPDGSLLAEHDARSGSSSPNRGRESHEVRVPLATSALVVELDQYTPMFGGDEIRLVRVLGAYLSLALERCRLLEGDREVAQQLTQVDRMKTAFIAAASHDLRTPLAVMVGFADTLERLDDQIDATQRAGYLRLIVESGERLSRLLDEMLDLTRFADGRIAVGREPIELLDLVRRVATSTPVTGADVSVVGEPVELHGDEALLERIVENLVVNADRHAGTSARVVVGVESNEFGAIVTVDDDGPGVPAELRERIFEPFERALKPTGANGHGTGLGLAIVGRFAELHGGRAWVEDSVTLGGARFCVLVPRLP